MSGIGKNVKAAYSDTSLWPSPKFIPDLKKDRYFSLVNAITLLMDGKTLSEVESETGIGRSVVYRLARRALTINPATGDIFGFYVALRYYRLPRGVNEESRGQRQRGGKPEGSLADCVGSESPIGLRKGTSSSDDRNSTDAMNPALTSPKRGGWKLTRIFEAFPEIEAMIDDLYFQRGAFKAEVRPPYSFISQKVREALQALHVQPCDFPGYEAIRRYCKSLVVTNPKAVIRARYGKQAARNYEKEQVGLNIFEGMPLLSVRQLDFHTWDGHTVLHIVDPNGCDHAVPVSRFSIGVMIDENPGAIHGFSIVFEATPSSDDFLETVASALHAYDEDVEMNVKMTMTPRRDVVIGGVVPELKNNAFTVLRTDNAFAMTCKDSIANTMDVTGCIFQFGVPYAWWGRPKIERFNGIFEQRTGHRLPSTTGSGPGDSRRGNSYEMAFGFDINLNDIVETLAEFTEFHNRSYSGKPTHGQTIENIIKTNLKNPASEMIVNPLPKSGHDDWTNMAYVVSGTVRSSAKNGVAPHINALYCRYTFPDHEKRFDLDKKKVYVIIHRRNANIAIAVVKDTNEYLGYLRPEKRWRIAPVPVIMRKRISKKIKRSGSDSLAGNPVDSYIDELSSRVTNGKIDSKLGLEIASLKQQQERTQSVRDYRDSQSDVSESANQIVRSKSVQILDFSKKSMELPVTPDEHERKISKW